MIWLLLACAKDVEDSATPITNYSEKGPYNAGHSRVLLTENERPLTVEVWYPTQDALAPQLLPGAFLSGTQESQYQELLNSGNPGCATEETQATFQATPLPGEHPLVVFSHCHECVRFSSFTVAEHLASWGFVVAAPDHAGNTLWEKLSESGLPLNAETLALRFQDQQQVLDAMLIGGPEGVQVDPDRVAAMGHSFGSVTSGLLAQEDSRVKGALGLAAPMENPLLPGVETSTLDKPLAILLAVEDNSITALGNQLIVSNMEEAPNTAYRLDVADAGHWSVSDIAGLDPAFQAGCGTDERMTDGTEFEYLDPAQGSAIAGHFAAAFMAELLLGERGAVVGQTFDGDLVSGDR
ncbi:MAG: dienelactone hydrolase [Cognaticolwellia sp.]|jgi:dienelactone hydrolase